MPQGYPSLWQLKLSTVMGPLTTLAVFNLSGQTRSFTIEPAMLGFEVGREFVALEWWQSRWLGRFSAGFTLEVPPEDVAVIHAGAVSAQPSLFSVSQPIANGLIVREVAFQPETGLLKGTLETKAGLPLVLFGLTPPQWALDRTTLFHAASNTFGGWQCEFQTKNPLAEFTVGFEQVTA